MRARILEAAKSGGLERLATVMQSNELMPIFTFGNDRDPLRFGRPPFPIPRAWRCSASWSM